jgi:hypothetical protein
MNLARPFKAGFSETRVISVAKRRILSSILQFPALKGRAKFRPPLRGSNKNPQIAQISQIRVSSFSGGFSFLSLYNPCHASAMGTWKYFLQPQGQRLKY